MPSTTEIHPTSIPGTNATHDTRKPLNNVSKVYWARRCCCTPVSAPGSNVRCGAIEIAMKSNPTKAPPAPALARKNVSKDSGTMMDAPSTNDGGLLVPLPHQPAAFASAGCRARPPALLHPGQDVVAADADDVVLGDLGAQLPRKGGVAHDVEADFQQLRHLLRGVLILL